MNVYVAGIGASVCGCELKIQVEMGNIESILVGFSILFMPN